MDYINNKIAKQIKFISSSQIIDDHALKTYYQVRIEFLLIFIMSYYWNANIDILGSDEKEYVFRKILRPTFGDIIEIIRKLDINKEIFKNKQFYESLNKYPKIRNEMIGHGYTFGDTDDAFLKTLDELYNNINTENYYILANEVDLILVKNKINNIYNGVVYKSNGDYSPWSCPIETNEFKTNNIYGCYNLNTYFRLSPFIDIDYENDNEISIFCSIKENLTGNIEYNKLFKTGKKYKEWEELNNFNIEIDQIKRKSKNSTILNLFENNYGKYIEIDNSIKKEIKNFLINNKSSVCATLWGHGGVGKTAAIQSVIDDISNDNKRYFEYIIFLSAKDRYYDYYKASIKELNCRRFVTLSEIILEINRIVFGKDTDDKNLLINFNGKILIIIDDFETFLQKDKKDISDFIKSLNINNHKIVITTRSATLITGEEIQTNELSEEATKKFLFEILKIKNQTNLINNELNSKEISKKIYEVTSGRPLFIFQLAILIGQKGSVNNVIEKFDLKSTPQAIDFLYGRIYEYLSSKAKDIFVVISLIVSKNDLSNLIEKLKFILNEENSTNFDIAFDELAKLKIIENTEEGFFKLYSQEILEIMSEYYHKRDERFKDFIQSRIKLIAKEKTLDNERALLVNADSNRVFKNEEEVLSGYRHIVNRPTSPLNIKLHAVLNMAEYLFNDRGKKEDAVKILKDYRHLFLCNNSFVKIYSGYLWSTGKKKEAINILQDCYVTKVDSIKNNLELSGLLLTYDCIYEINNKEEIKEKDRRNEINKPEFIKLIKSSNEEFKRIVSKIGKPLFEYCKEINIQNITPAAKQNITVGFFQLVNVCIRIKDFNFALEICNFIIENMSSHYHQQFKSKIDQIKKYYTEPIRK